MLRGVAQVLLIACVLLYADAARADGAFDNLLVSKRNGIATVQVWPACRMRYVDHSPQGAGKELRIRVDTGPDCSERLAEVFSERYADDSLRLAGVEEVVFDARSPGNTFITVRFREPQRFVVRQRAVGWIEIDVDTLIDPSTTPATMPAPLSVPEEPAPPPVVSSRPRPRPAPAATVAPPERTSRRVNPPSSTTGDYVVQLGVFSDLGPARARLREVGGEHFGFASEFVLNGATWHSLSLGFFDSEADASAVLEALRRDYPDAWVRFTSDTERTAALAAGDIRDNSDERVAAVQVQNGASGDDATADRLLAEGRRALLAQNYAGAIDSLSRALEIPGHSRRHEARELLGVAFERNGQPANAIAEYEAALDESPDSPDAPRIRARRDGIALVLNDSASTPLPRTLAARSGNEWQFTGGVSQYYWRNQEQLVHDGNYLVSTSGVLGLADITASRRGARFDVLARFNGAYQFNLVEFDDDGDVGWVSNAFVDVVDGQLGLQGRFGRQTDRSGGAIGRFDGAALSWRWRPDITFGLSTGIPMDSPRYISDSSRFFYSVKAEFESLLKDRLQASIFTKQQTVDGISDAQTLGAEIRYSDGPLSVIGLVDADLSYSVLNTALVNASWQLDNGWSVNARGSVGALPYLTTRNALAGQTATSIDELLETYTEGQIRTLARDRTAQATSGTVALSIPLGERFDVSLDVTARRGEATVASGGVAAIPDTGTQTFLNATVVGTSLLRENDLLLMSLRSTSTRTRDTQMLLLDARLPFGRALRFSPRVTVEQHSFANGTDQQVISPSVRIMYRWKNLLLDLEAGGRWSNRDVAPTELDPFTPDGVEDLYGGFVNLGYRWEF